MIGAPIRTTITSFASQLDGNAKHFDRDDDGQPRDNPTAILRHDDVSLFLH
jgi:hypothetical protein